MNDLFFVLFRTAYEPINIKNETTKTATQPAERFPQRVNKKPMKRIKLADPR